MENELNLSRKRTLGEFQRENTFITRINLFFKKDLRINDSSSG